MDCPSAPSTDLVCFASSKLLIGVTRHADWDWWILYMLRALFVQPYCRIESIVDACIAQTRYVC